MTVTATPSSAGTRTRAGVAQSPAVPTAVTTPATPSTHAGGFAISGEPHAYLCSGGAGTHGRHDNSVIAGGVDRLEGTLIRKHDPDTTAEWVPWEAALMGVGGNRESWDNNSREGV